MRAIRTLGLLTALQMLIALPMAAQKVVIDSMAERMLVYQRSYGGWPKAIGNHKVDYTQPLSKAAQLALIADSNEIDGTLDNNATSREIRYLVKAYAVNPKQAYRSAIHKGLGYLLKAQYANGGWPQFYPDSSRYRAQITFNDDAMINVLNLLQDVAERKGDFQLVDEAVSIRAKAAVDKGLRCILETQVIVKGKRTAWAAQYDQHTLTPAQARAYELPSLACSESVRIVQFLMRQHNPSPAVKSAVVAAMQWFDVIKITGYAAKRIQDSISGKDLVLVKQPGAVIWARFYDLRQMKPLFAGRDGIPRTNLAAVAQERRGGYAWYGTWPATLTDLYQQWKLQHLVR